MQKLRILRRAGILLWRIKCELMYLAAFLWRRLLFRTTFIAITGSVGKTTAKECLATILASRARTAKTLRNQNGIDGLPRTMLRVRPWHRFAVLEVATSGHGQMRKWARMVRPHVAVVLAVARAHMKSFRTLENVAREKSMLPAALSPGGIAVLNGDDPLVAGMANGRYRVVWFGSSPEFDLHADELTSGWPERLSFRVHACGGSMRVQTRLIGTHWKNSVLAALAASQACGVPMADAVRAIASVEPVPGRLQPVTLPSGAVLIRDDYNGSTDTLAKALPVLAEAKAARKFLVISDVTDSSQRPRDRLAKFGREAARIANFALFIGPRAEHGVKGALSGGMPPGHALSFATFEPAVEFLASELRQNDLVLVRGRTCDHLARVYFKLLGTVKCRKLDCEKTLLCDYCSELGFKPCQKPGLAGLPAGDSSGGAR